MGRMKFILGLLALSVAAQIATAQTGEKICNVALQACPKTLEGTTINVPDDAIWLEPKLPFCPEQVQVQTGANAAAPSLVFIIDNSGSMDDTDPQEQRFKVTISLLDSIYKAQPATKVALVIFCRRLVFDHRDNAFFRQADLGDPNQHDSYVPLTALNHRFPNGVLGVDSLKALLAFDNGGGLNHATKLPATRQNPDNNLALTDVRGGTDITLGFQAAKQALIGDTNPKENQFFIFLSDGAPSGVDVVRDGIKMDWVQGVGVPTTFTVFFTTSSQPPNAIVNMNTNIRENGYSTNNPKSNTWAINLQASQLLPLLSAGVLNPIFSNKAATPASAHLVSGTTTLDNSSMDGGNFIFPSRVPLAAGQTSVALTYNYTYVDSGKTKTHTATYNVNIRRVPAGTPGAPPAGVTTICKDAGDIILLVDGKKINIVTADHEKVDVRLTLPNGETCTDCKVTVQPQPKVNRPGTDTENIPVVPAGGQNYTGSFTREIAETAASGDGKLQHTATDSIVVTWVNPRNPLEVIRRTFPYSDVNTILKVVNHNVYSQTDVTTPMDQRKQWVLVGSSNVQITPEDGKTDCCRLVPALTAEDSSKYVGIKVTASRSFKVDVRVYDNLGQFVNKLAFSVSQAEFANLAREATGTNRSLRVLWDNRTESGDFAGTGAYVFKTTVTLNRVPGISEEQVVRTDHRLVGVVRGR